MQLTQNEKDQLKIQLAKMIERYGMVNIKQTLDSIQAGGRIGVAP